MNTTVRLSKNLKSSIMQLLNNRKTFYFNLNRIPNTKLAIRRSRTRKIFGKDFKTKVVFKSIKSTEDIGSSSKGSTLRRKLALEVGSFA
jgi:hypothetical protein